MEVGNIIVAKCPGFTRTVPEFRPMSQLCPDWHKIVFTSRNFYQPCELELQRFHADPKEDTVDVLEPAISKTKTELNFSLLVKKLPLCLLQQQG